MSKSEIRSTRNQRRRLSDDYLANYYNNFSAESVIVENLS